MVCLRTTTVFKESKSSICNRFAMGTCTFGERCRFVHSQTPSHGSPRAPAASRPKKVRVWCSFKGHLEFECNKKKRGEPQRKTTRPAPVALVSLTEPSEADPFAQTNLYTFMITENHLCHPGWVVDSGATVCATYDASDCIDISPCNILITAAGSSFHATQRGTAIIDTVTDSGSVQQLRIKNCLIFRIPLHTLRYEYLHQQSSCCDG